MHVREYSNREPAACASIPGPQKRGTGGTLILVWDTETGATSLLKDHLG